MKKVSKKLSTGAAVASLALASSSLFASSHMDAPLITLDDAANTTDVYAFVSAGKDDNGYETEFLTTALAVYPFEEPGIGPNNYRFDDNVRYEIHIALDDDIDKGRATLSYQFRFETEFKNDQTIAQAFLGEVTCAEGTLDDDGFDPNQNLRQTYTVTKVDHRRYKRRILGTGRVPPNNQGLVTPEYNTADGGVPGEGVAKGGVDSEAALDECTTFGITELAYDHRAFAGQRDDGFYADIQSIFDLDFSFGGDNKPFDSQGGFNLHTIVLDIPLSKLDGAQMAAVFATTSRQRKTKLSRFPEKRDDKVSGPFIQVGRQGNPLFNEAFVPIEDKDLYNRTDPTRDRDLFLKFAREPELAALLDLPAALRTDRDDLAGIFIPDLIKVDLTTGPARLAGAGPDDPDNPDDTDFSRLSVFGGDTLNGAAGGFPNGRRFGDDVLDIAILALIKADPTDPGTAATDVDGVTKNDISFNKVFPYAATPLNGRNHEHH